MEKIHKNIKEDWWETEEKYKFWIQKPELQEQIRKTVFKLQDDADELQNIALHKDKDCTFIISEIIKAYSTIEKQYSATLDSVRVRAKIKKNEVAEMKTTFKKNLKFENLISFKNDFDCSTVYLLSELVKLDISIQFLVNSVADFTPSRKPVYENIPIVIPEKLYYKPGDVFKTDVYVGSIISARDSTDFVEINGQDYMLIDNKIEFQEIVPNQKGKRKIKMIYKKKNLNTKKIEKQREAEYEYEIR